jgi:hypothetical protein
VFYGESAQTGKSVHVPELELHRADFAAIQAAGFHDPGELLSAYQTLLARTDTSANGKARKRHGSAPTTSCLSQATSSPCCMARTTRRKRATRRLAIFGDNR